MVLLGIIAIVTAIVVDSSAGLLIVGFPALVVCGAIATNAGGFGQRARASATWGSLPALDLRLFRIVIGGGGFVISLILVVGGLTLLLR